VTKSQFNLTVRLAALLVASVAVLCLYRWYYAHGDPDARNNFSESRAERQTPSIPLKPTEEPMRKELTQIIKSQLTAFRDNDYVTAYTFSAAGIREKFPLAAFERMVKTGYAAIAQFKSAEFGVVLDNGEEAIVNVEIEGESNRIVHYQYFLRKENGSWKIAGVIEVKPKGTVA
jgi:hypothetical protein